jgi:hypothetical protein
MAIEVVFLPYRPVLVLSIEPLRYTNPLVPPLPGKMTPLHPVLFNHQGA